jgi:hypothetical protein
MPTPAATMRAIVPMLPTSAASFGAAMPAAATLRRTAVDIQPALRVMHSTRHLYVADRRDHDGRRSTIAGSPFRAFYFCLSFAIIRRTAFNVDDFISNEFGTNTMQIRVSLNAGATDAADIRAALDAELHGLEQPDLEITTQKKPIEAGALALAEAYQFILDYGPGLAKALPLVTAVLQLSNAVLQRRGITAKKKAKAPNKKTTPKKPTVAATQPLVLVQVEDRFIELPAEQPQLKKFLNSLSKPEQPSAGRSAADKPRKAGTTKKKKRTAKR